MSFNKCPFASCPNFGRYCRRTHDDSEKQQPVSAETSTHHEYKKAAKELKATGGSCQIKSPVCVGGPIHPHHPYGRIGKNMVRELIPSCNPCNQYIEDHPEWARARGFKKSKHEPNYKRIK